MKKELEVINTTGQKWDGQNTVDTLDCEEPMCPACQSFC